MQINSDALRALAEAIAREIKSETPAAVAADCMAHGVIIGRTNRSFERHNNTLCLSPALIVSKSEIDEIVDAIDGALGRVA